MASTSSVEPDFESTLPLHEKPPKPQLPCIYLDSPDRGRVFFGRQGVLNAVRDALLPRGDPSKDSTGLRQFTLCGLGGVGKTEIAMEFALRFKSSFDAVFWVRADETAKLDKCFQDISVKLGLESADQAHSQVVSRSILKEWLADPTKGDVAAANVDINSASWLMIFDNADDPMLLRDYWPDGPGSVLITSRAPSAKQLYSNHPLGIDLEPLSDGDGGALLLQLTKSAENSEEDAESTARRISHDLAGLPLALAQMAGIIRRDNLSLSNFLSMYQEKEERSALYGTKLGTGLRDYPHSIATVWAFEKLSKGAKILLQVASFLDPDIIQESILSDATAALLPRSSFSKSQYNKALVELLHSSLFKRDNRKNDSAGYRVSVHRLVRETVIATMPATDVDSTIGVLIDILWKNWPPTLGPSSKSIPFLKKEANAQHYQVSRYPQCAALYPHIIAVKQGWKLTSNCTDQTKLQFAALLTDGALYQNERGRTHDFDGFLAFAEELCNGTEGDATDAVLVDLHYCLGLISAGNNNLTKARHHQEAFFSLQKRICESISPDYIDEKLCLAYCELGLSHLLGGRLNESIEAHEHETAIRKRLGPNNFLNNIPLGRAATAASAYMLRALPEDLDEAERVLVEQLEIAERTGTSKSSHVTGRITYTLANLRALQGRHTEAYELHLKAHRLLVETFSEREIPRSKHKLAEYFMGCGRYEEAIKTITEALHIWRYDAEVYRPELARTTFLNAQVLEKMGKTQEADSAYKVAGQLRKEVVPTDNRDVKNLAMKDFDAIVTFWTR
ncbi:P-loop containing nucleoside triphosphate hydrolase protein [Nemania abortiva]|nr:P-loop containing nucleoside triphosphate hydrolase protein [Nemania abortiva]